MEKKRSKSFRGIAVEQLQGLPFYVCIQCISLHSDDSFSSHLPQGHLPRTLDSDLVGCQHTVLKMDL